jgi:hypothetical protein
MITHARLICGWPSPYMGYSSEPTRSQAFRGDAPCGVVARQGKAWPFEAGDVRA